MSSLFNIANIVTVGKWFLFLQYHRCQSTGYEISIKPVEVANAQKNYFTIVYPIGSNNATVQLITTLFAPGLYLNKR